MGYILWDVFGSQFKYYGMGLAAILDSSKKVGITFYFWIIRVVNSQLALNFHVRCNPLDTSKTTLKHSQMHHGIYIMQCIWQPFWILQERVGISFNFWIIRLVNNQSEFYSQVRCNPFWPPLDIPETPQNTPTWQLKFQLWGFIFARCNMLYCC